MRNLQIILHKDRIGIGDYNQKLIKQVVTDNDNKPIRAHIVFDLPESRNARSYCMGCLIPLIVYLDDNDYRDSDICEVYFNFLKKEISPEVIKINGTIETYGKSTKGRKNLSNFIEKLHDYLNEEYGISYDNKATKPEEYKKFKDELFSSGKWETWIEYCKDMKWIDKNKLI